MITDFTFSTIAKRTTFVKAVNSESLLLGIQPYINISNKKVTVDDLDNEQLRLFLQEKNKEIEG